ncbi:MAG: hypothetical protein ACJ76B_02105 [Solirubrobacterales bacterium]
MQDAVGAEQLLQLSPQRRGDSDGKLVWRPVGGRLARRRRDRLSPTAADIA